MAKRKMTIPIALVAGLAAGVANPIKTMVTKDVAQGVDELLQNYTGFKVFSPPIGFRAERLMGGLVPLIIGAVVHKVVGGTLGINRELGRAGVPFIRI